MMLGPPKRREWRTHGTTQIALKPDPVRLAGKNDIHKYTHPQYVIKYMRRWTTKKSGGDFDRP